MIRRLSEKEMTVGELAEPLVMSLAAASKHVQVLQNAGVVQRTILGRRHVCRLAPGSLASAFEWLRSYEKLWNGNAAGPDGSSRDAKAWAEETD